MTSGAKSVRGLDLLGLRAPVQSIGNALLDGITTVTPTVRYLGLRSWLLRRYAEARLPDNADQFTNFAARFEAAVVLGNLLLDPKTRGLVGSGKAVTQLAGPPTESVDLRAFVDQIAASIYTGPSNQLLISYESDGQIPGLTEERGLALYHAVDGSLGDTRVAKAFRDDPKTCLIERTALQELGAAFRIASPPPHERASLLAAILPAEPRDAERPRLATYAVLLELASVLGDDFSENSLFEEAARRDRRIPEGYYPHLDQWLAYLVRDNLAVVHECALRAVVDRLSTPAFVGQAIEGHQLLTDLLADATDHSAALRAVGLWEDATSPLSLPFNELRVLVQQRTQPRTPGAIPRWDGLTEDTVMTAAAKAGPGALVLLPVAWLLALERLRDTRGVEPFSSLLDYDGFERIGAFEVMEPAVEVMLSQAANVGEVCLELAHRTVEQHLRMAWTRLSSDPTHDVSVVAADGDRWHLVEGRAFEGGRTASRLSQAIGWLRQLGLLTAAGLTDDGRRYLDRLRQVLGVAGHESS